MILQKLRRTSYTLLAAVLVLAGMSMAVPPKTAHAYGLLTSREIRMASTVANAADVTYLVRMTTPSTDTIGGMVIDFCSNSPIIGDSCTAPVGFDTNHAALALANQTGITDWNVSGSSTANTLMLTRTTPASFTAGTFTLELGSTGGSDGIHNPSGTGTFYARVLTYTTNAGATSYTAASPGAEPPLNFAGGTALSTNDQITVQSKVQERLTFCVYTSAINYANCTVSTTNPVVLGDANGVLDPGTAYVNKSTKYNVSTNASNGVTIRAKGPTLTSGSFTITEIGATPAASATGTEQFGLCTYRDSGGGATGLTPVSKYDGTNGANNCTNTTAGASGDGGSNFAFDLSTACGSTASAAGFGEGNMSCRYGDAIATKSAGTMSTGVIAFLGNISNTTEPGIYTTTLTFVATGNY